jgi:cytochrome c oxidase subunit III
MEIPYTTKPREDTGLYNAKLGIWLFLASEVMLFGALFSSYILLRVSSGEGMWPHGLMNIPIGTFNTVVLITSSVTVVLSWAALKLGDFKKYRRIQTVTVICALMFLGIKSWEYNEKFHHYEVWFNEAKTVEAHPELKSQSFVEPGTINEDFVGTIPSVVGHLGYTDKNGEHQSAGAFWDLKKLKEDGIEEVEVSLDAFHYRIPARIQHEMTKEHHGDNHGGEHATLKVKTDEIRRVSAFVPGHSTFFAIYFTMTALHGLHVLAGALVIAYILWRNNRLWKRDPERYANRVEVSGLFWHFVDLVWIFLFPILYLL